MNNRQNTIFHSLDNFLNPALALLGQDLKKLSIQQNLSFYYLPIIMQRSQCQES